MIPYISIIIIGKIEKTMLKILSPLMRKRNLFEFSNGTEQLLSPKNLE